MKLATLAAALALPIMAQTATPSAASVPSLPADLVSIYGSYNSTASPKFAGGVSLALRASTAGVYSYTSIDFTLLHGKIQQTTRTGAAVFMRQFGNVYVFALGTAGATSTSAATLLSGSFGVFGAYKINDKLAVVADVQQSNTTKATARLGIAYYFGK